MTQRANNSKMMEQFRRSKEVFQRYLEGYGGKKHYLEFGIGCTTQWALGVEGLTILSIDEDPSWIDESFDSLSKEQQSRIKFKYSEFKDKTDKSAQKFASAIHSTFLIPDVITIGSGPTDIIGKEVIKYVKNKNTNPYIFIWTTGKKSKEFAEDYLNPIDGTEDLLLRPYTVK